MNMSQMGVTSGSINVLDVKVVKNEGTMHEIVLIVD